MSEPVKRKIKRHKERFAVRVTPRIDRDRAKCSSGKYLFRNRKIARQAAAEARERFQSPTIEEYPCGECRAWHIGRKKAKGEST